ncbi:MAG: hypothetical protein ACE5JS_19585 [Nitrospinota bacterium]
MALASGVGDIVEFHLKVARQITATTTDALLFKVPFKCRIVKVIGAVGAIGGTVDPTDVDLMIENGTTDILSAQIAAVDASAIASAPVTGTVAAGQDALAEDDVIHLDVTVTGGTSPTVDDVDVWVYAVRE